MKCEIIKDLLPLYIENSCSEESKIMIEQHLQECNECRDLLKELKEDIKIYEIDEINTDINLKDKDLLLNAKKNIRFEFIKKIFKVIYYSVIILNILLIAFGYLVIKIGYDLEYPKLYFDNLGILTYIILFGLFISPLLFSTIGIAINNKMNYVKRYMWKFVLSTIALTFSILLSVVSGFIIISVIPPFESFTNSTKDYLVVGKDMHKYEKIYKDFFPEEIPDDAVNVNYSYRKYNGLFETKGEIYASWSLPIEKYKYYKQIIEDNAVLNLIEGNKYEVHLRNHIDPDGLTLNFEYDDDKKELKYIASIEN